MSEELRKRMVHVCCVQEVQWRGEGAQFLGINKRRYELWWSSNFLRIGEIKILVKKKLSEKVLEVQRSG